MDVEITGHIEYRSRTALASEKVDSSTAVGPEAIIPGGSPITSDNSALCAIVRIL